MSYLCDSCTLYIWDEQSFEEYKDCSLKDKEQVDLNVYMDSKYLVVSCNKFEDNKDWMLVGWE